VFFGIKFISSDNAVGHFLARFILQGYPGAKENPVPVVRRLGYDIQGGQAFLQIMNASVYAA